MAWEYERGLRALRLSPSRLAKLEVPTKSEAERDLAGDSVTVPRAPTRDSSSALRGAKAPEVAIG